MGWYQLLSISKEARQLREDERRAGPVACPNDGEPLQYNPVRGILFCPWGDFSVVGRPSGI